jgi:hypothetical protein
MQWRGTNGWGTRLLAIWLIASGSLALLGAHFPQAGPILSVLAIAAGVLILMRR